MDAPEPGVIDRPGPSGAAKRAHRLREWRFGEQAARLSLATAPMTSVMTVSIQGGFVLFWFGLPRSGADTDQWHPLLWAGLGVMLVPLLTLVAAWQAIVVVKCVGAPSR